jgi:hypothetical protein
LKLKVGRSTLGPKSPTRTKIIPLAPSLLGSAPVKTSFQHRVGLARSTHAREPRVGGGVARTLFAGIAGVLAALLPSAAYAGPATTSVEQGYDLGEIQAPRGIGMGGALNALGSSTEGLYLNPANLTSTRVYHFELLGSYWLDAQRYSLGGAVLDSSSSRLAGGFAGSASCQDCIDSAGINRNFSDLRLGVAYPFGTLLSIGVIVRYLHVGQAISTGPFGPNLVSDGTPSGPVLSTFTADLGVAVTPIPQLHFGVVGHNLTDPGTGLAPTTVAGGVGYDGGAFAVEADLLGDFTTYGHPEGRVMAGGELFVGQHVPLRLGYRYDDGTQTHGVYAGFGYINKQWGAELSGGRDLYATHPSTLFGLSLRYFYDSSGLGNNQAAEPDSF